jgi:hypothetical protein
MHQLSAWAERRPERTERERAEIADRQASHLPPPEQIVRVSDADIDAMRAAFIRRFDEDLPRTETLMAVANIGYRMALRDLASADTHPKGGNSTEIEVPAPLSGAVGAAETPKLQDHPHQALTHDQR